MNRSVLSLHEICGALGEEFTKCLPALHALTGCDTNSKVSTKLAALTAIQKPKNSLLIVNFDYPQLTENAVQMGETFLVRYLKPSTDHETFDDLPLVAFNTNALNFNFEKKPCTSTNTIKHIQRTYHQQQL